jgi:hypothetical protein
VGHERRFRDVDDESGLPPIADVVVQRREPTKWAISGLMRCSKPAGRLFDHLVGACAQRRRNVEPIALTVMRFTARSNLVGFHAALRLDRRGRLYAAPAETRILGATYPAPIRGWIERNGGLSDKPIFLSSRQLAALYPRCQ